MFKSLKFYATLLICLFLSNTAFTQNDCGFGTIEGNLILVEADNYIDHEDMFFLLEDNDLVASLTVTSNLSGGVVNYALEHYLISNYISVNTNGLFASNLFDWGIYQVHAIYGLDTDLDGFVDDLYDDCNTTFTSQIINADNPIVVDYQVTFSAYNCYEVTIQYFLSGGEVDFYDNDNCEANYIVNGDSTICANTLYNFVNPTTGDSILNNCIDSVYLEITDLNGNVYIFNEEICLISLSGGICPIELITFEGKQTQNGNELFWQTATELENDYYSILKSYDGENFKLICTKTGAGTTGKTQTYTYLDEDINHNFDKTYYKLLQTDIDGTETEVEVIIVEKTIDANLTNFQIDFLYYDANLNQLEINYQSNKGNSSFVIYNLSGNVIAKGIFDNQIGKNLQQINLNSLTANLYLIQLKEENKIIARKFSIY